MILRIRLDRSLFVAAIRALEVVATPPNGSEHTHCLAAALLDGTEAVLWRGTEAECLHAKGVLETALIRAGMEIVDLDGDGLTSTPRANEAAAKAATKPKAQPKGKAKKGR